MPLPPSLSISLDWSSTNSRQISVLFRIANPTNAAITWTPYMYYTCFGGWGNYASLSLNGVVPWYNTGTCQYCTVSPCRFLTRHVLHTLAPQVSLSLTIPPGRTSNIMVVVSSGGPSTTQTVYLSFYSGSLALPPGLQYVDDLMAAQGLGWEV